MAAHVLDEHRMDPRRLVEVPAGRLVAVPEHLRVHADGADPLSVGCPLGGLGDARHQVRDGRHAGVAHVDRGELSTREREMVMRVHEPRQDGAPANVDQPGVVRSGGTGRVVVADGRDPVAHDSDPTAERRFSGPCREHPTVEQDEPAHRDHLRTCAV